MRPITPRGDLDFHVAVYDYTVTPQRSLLTRLAGFIDVRVRKAGRHSVQRMRRVIRPLLSNRSGLRETRWGVTMLRAAEFAQAPVESHHRRGVARRYLRGVAGDRMDASAGHCLLPHERFDADLLAKCRHLFEVKTGIHAGDGHSSGAGRLRAEKQMFLRNLLSNDDLTQNPWLVDFALDDAVLGMATRYLGAVPRLNRIDLLYSVPRETDDNIASQLFHVDPEGVTQVKFFFNLFDTGDDQGPFTFIPADESRRILREVRSLHRAQGNTSVGRCTDAEIAAVGGTSAIVTVKGPAGSGVAVDTSRCLHLGSRVRRGSFRLCLYLQFCTSRERGNVFDVGRYRSDMVRYLAVRDSIASVGTNVAAPHQMAG